MRVSTHTQFYQDIEELGVSDYYDKTKLLYAYTKKVYRRYIHATPWEAERMCVRQ